MRAALTWTFFWIVSALVFTFILWCYSSEKALAFFTGYVIEKSLSVDNLFVFYLIFEQFRIPPLYQHRIFFYGISGAIIMRLLLILLGSYLIKEFHWLLYIMGVFLLITGIKMFFVESDKKDLYQSKLYRFLQRHVRLTHEIKGQEFFVRKNSLLYATPLFIALIFIEISDLVFAFDSLPAIFAITTDPFIVWTSNIFAILGLRSLYFVLSGMIKRFYLLKYGIALILVFVGIKMVIAPWVYIPVSLSLSVIALLLLVFCGLSFLRSR